MNTHQGSPKVLPFHAQSADHVLSSLESQSDGLSPEQVTTKQQQFGANRLTPHQTESNWHKFFKQFHNVLIYVLLVSATLSWLIGRWTDGVVIFSVVLINGVFGFIQEGKAEAALASIKALIHIQTTVLRSGLKQKIEAEALVPGDIVLLESGDRVPADIRLIDCINLLVQEGALTGESFSVEKNAAPVDESTPLAERHCMLFAGTLIAQGRAQGVVVAIGDNSEIGKIGTMLRNVEPLATPLMQKLSALGHITTRVILFFAIITFLFGWFWRNYAITELFMAAIGLAVAAIPEGLPAVITITLAIGVQRMARHKAIIRRLPAVETLGSVSVICTDKTGTLTRNEMTVQSIRMFDGEYHMSGVGYYPDGQITYENQTPSSRQIDSLRRLAIASLLCNDARFDQNTSPWTLHGDPTEGALLILAAKMGAKQNALLQHHPRVAEIPFESSHGYMATLHTTQPNSPYRYEWVLKGAPEKVLALCQSVWTDHGVTPLEPNEWHAAIQSFADRGERVLAIAVANTDQMLDQDGALSADLARYEFHLLGLVGIMDPPRDEARTAIAQCQEAGIHLIMVTGDHASTAAAIGKQLGLKSPLNVITGSELETLSDLALQEKASTLDVVARATPEHKLRLVTALQADHQIVAMTGDGVNDAPALKRSDIGVAMGVKGTDAAKDASEMVLADDNFATLRTAVLEGRTVYDNLRKALVFIFPTNGGQALVMIAAILLGITLPITPVQILWVNMVSAITLSLPLGFEKPAADIMHRRPRQSNEPILPAPLLFRIGFVSLLLMFLTLGMYYWAMHEYNNLAYARTVAINSLVGAEMVYLVSCRSLLRHTLSLHAWVENPYVILAIVVLSTFQVILTHLPVMQLLFGTASIHLHDWMLILITCFLMYLLMELEKWISRILFAPE